MSLRLSWAAALAAAVLTVGCQKSEEEEFEPAIVPKTVAFEGKVDEKYAGTWVTADGKSTLGLSKDGALKVGTVTNSPQGKKTASLDGKWLASDGSLLMKYADASGQDTVLKYLASFEGTKLVLQQSAGGMKTVYNKK
ncbi:hypothetical protein EON79_12525 [bacterium]|nr:MAG: hypothetical protein EON79_12525 [bacterium]